MASAMMPLLRQGAVLAILLVAGGCAGGPARDTPGTRDLVQVAAAAEAAALEGRHVDAVEGFERLVRELPEDPGYWYQLGNAYHRSGRLAEATMAYEQSLSLQPSNARAWHNLGITLATQARDAFHAGLRSNPTEAGVGTQLRRMATALDAALSEPAAPDPHSPPGGPRDDPSSPQN